MAERGAVPQVPVLQRRALKAIRGLFTPLLPQVASSMVGEVVGMVRSVRSRAGGHERARGLHPPRPVRGVQTPAELHAPPKEIRGATEVVAPP